MLVIINFIFALIFFFIFLIMLHLEPSFTIIITTKLIKVVTKQAKLRLTIAK